MSTTAIRSKITHPSQNEQQRKEVERHWKRNLLINCCHSKNLQKTLEIFERLKSENYPLTSGNWALLIDLYTYHSKSSDALALYAEVKAKDPEFKLDNLKVVRLADLLIREDRFDEALTFLANNKKSESSSEGEIAFKCEKTVWGTLDQLAKAGEEQKLRLYFDALDEGKYVLPNNELLEPLIQVHLIKDEVTKAMEEFERICEKYKETPMTIELACRLMQLEDETNLQKLTDLSTQINGEEYSLHGLFYSFLECGRIVQARKILETPGLRASTYIDNACKEFKNEVQPLEGLIEATKDMDHIDRNNIFYNLLLSYCKTEDAEKALGLWTKMQEEDVTPSEIFLKRLAKLLRKKKMPVPFVVPLATNATKAQKTNASAAATTSAVASTSAAATASAAVAAATNATQKKPKAELHSPTNLSQFRKAINNGNVDDALRLKSQFDDNETLNVIDASNLIKLLTRAGRLVEATKNVEELLTKDQYPQLKVFKFYLNKIAAAGDVATMERIGAQIPDEKKKLVSFDNRYCRANIIAGKVNEYLNRLHEEISGAQSSEEANKLAEKFPRGGAIGLLDSHPEILPQYQQLAEKFAEFNRLGPINVLWMHLISRGDVEKSKQIWEKYLSNYPRLMFQSVLQTAREQKNGKLAQTVIDQLRQSKISEGAIGNAYSCLIDIHTASGNIDKAMDTLKTALKDVCLENINRTALLRLKQILTDKNQPFPYSIPEKKSKAENSSSSSSSSSSDDDVTPLPPETRSSKPSATKDNN